MNKEQDERLAQIIRTYNRCDERGKNDILEFAKAAAKISRRYKNKTEPKE